MSYNFKVLKKKKIIFIKKLSSIVLTSLILLTSSSPGFAKNIHGLNPSQFQQLKLLSMPIFLPTYLPEGFHVDNVSSFNVGTVIQSSYKITYTKTLSDGKRQEFFIETSNDGIGDIFLSNPIKVKSRFGDTQIYVDSMTENEPITKINNCIYMQWICYKGNCFRIVSGGGCDEKDDVYSDTLRISKEEAIKVISSIVEMK